LGPELEGGVGGTRGGVGVGGVLLEHGDLCLVRLGVVDELSQRGDKLVGVIVLGFLEEVFQRLEKRDHARVRVAVELESDTQLAEVDAVHGTPMRVQP
jgi:hypothetical protein